MKKQPQTINFDLEPRTIFLALTGSRAYGTDHAESDYDYRGIVIPPLSNYISTKDKFEQITDDKFGNKTVWKYYKDLVQPESDMQIMEITKFVRLGLESNPHVIEILFTFRPECIIKKLPIMEKLLEHRKLFLTKRARERFSAYSLGQLHKMKRHKQFIENPPKAPPKRSDYHLPEYKLISIDQLGAAESIIQKEINEFIIDQTDLPEYTKVILDTSINKMMKAVWQSIYPNKEYPVGDDKQFSSMNDALFDECAKEQGFTDNFIEVLKSEKKYRAAKQQWDSYQTWLKERNQERAESEIKFGFDLKNAGHLIRLLREAREILETENINVYREDSEELKEIKAGVWSYEKIIEFAEKEDAELIEVAKKSNLPNEPPIDKINEIVLNIVTEFNNNFAASEIPSNIHIK